MKKLAEYMRECKDYMDNSEEKDRNHFFSRDTVFSAAQRAPIKAMLNSIKKANGEQKETSLAVDTAFKELKKIFLEMFFDDKHMDPAGRVISFSFMYNDRDRCAKQIDEGKGTKGMRMIYQFKKAIDEQQVEYDYGRPSPIDKIDPLYAYLKGLAL